MEKASIKEFKFKVEEIQEKPVIKIEQQKVMINKFREAFERMTEQTQEEKQHDMANQTARLKAQEEVKEQ